MAIQQDPVRLFVEKSDRSGGACITKTQAALSEGSFQKLSLKTFELEPELSKINETELGLLFNDLMAARRHQDSPHISKRPNLLIQEVSAVRIYFDMHRARSLHS